ncbi:MAG: PQQ-binding-like beta-propeller repeat protein [Planctomycetota bacterium]
MSFLSHGQLRHGAWSSTFADGAHSARGIFAGPESAPGLWERRWENPFDAVVLPVIDSDGAIFSIDPHGRPFGLTATGAELPLPGPFDSHAGVPAGAIGTGGPGGASGSRMALTAGSNGPAGAHFSGTPELCLGPDRVLVVATADGLVCLSLTAGLRWQIRDLAVCAPLVAPSGNELYVLAPSQQKALIALGMGTGIEHWRTTFPLQQVSRPAIGADGTLYLTACFATGAQHWLLALDGRTGEERWRQKIAPTLTCAAPRLFGDELIFVGGDGGLQALPHNGPAHWAMRPGPMSEIAVNHLGQVLFLHDLKSQRFTRLTAYWPDGQLHAEAVVPPERGFPRGARPVVDAVGNVYLLRHADPASDLPIEVCRFDLDLHPTWTAPLRGAAPSGAGLAIGPRSLVIAAAWAAAGSAPVAAATPVRAAGSPWPSQGLWVLR